MAYSVPAENFLVIVNLLVRGDKRRSINGPGCLGVCRGGVRGRGGVNSLTISEPECSTFYDLSALLLMCEEITLFPTPLKITT